MAVSICYPLAGCNKKVGPSDTLSAKRGGRNKMTSLFKNPLQTLDLFFLSFLF